ncbi:M23 family metallopeptidase [Hirschia maritima]|uniref:M23 family metallopeptidase n=1 Tax=Hirschia maritima TaxID=1121961 RepID=UPI0003727937|nr:M23 family metallopeptidase [Hirschia maritima]
MFELTKTNVAKLGGMLAFSMVAACASNPPHYYEPPPMDELVINSYGKWSFPFDMNICPSIRVSNAPPTEARGQLKLPPFFSVDEKVVLATYPVEDACLSSGFGPRGGRSHKGVDYANPRPVQVYSAGQGVVVEAGFHRDFGNYVLLYHGADIYTRYAHLESIAPQIQKKYSVIMGEDIGVMGRTGRATGRHLHYELLKGNYKNPKKSFGLTAMDIFAMPGMWPKY